MTDRVTVSLDDESRTALDSLASETGLGGGRVARRVLTFHTANSRVARDDPAGTLERYSRIASSGERLLLDVDAE